MCIRDRYSTEIILNPKGPCHDSCVRLNIAHLQDKGHQKFVVFQNNTNRHAIGMANTFYNKCIAISLFLLAIKLWSSNKKRAIYYNIVI